MTKPEAVTIRLDNLDQLIERCPPSPFRKRRLREEAEKYLIEQVTALSGKSAVKLLIVLPRTETLETNSVAEAIHEHFNFLRIEAEKRLAETRRFGWRTLGIALLFLAAAIAAVQLLKRYLPAVTAISVITEGLTIFAWVALWRPGELLLYEWYPFTRDARLFRKLEESEIQLSYENTNGSARQTGVASPPNQ
jgi:hypothetical protein